LSAATKPRGRPATYADIEALPPNIVGEIIDGELMTHPRPSPRHGVAASALGVKLGDAFQLGSNGPRGWIFIDEPELHLGSYVLVPDIAGWRRERLNLAPDAAFIEIAPDWLCEVLSASTERRDRTVKMRVYAEAGIRHLWLIDPRLQILEAFELHDGRWAKAGAWNSRDEARAPPFEAVSISLADLWPLDRLLGLEENPQHLFAGDR
jgi:Uma2 family endonuclease